MEHAGLLGAVALLIWLALRGIDIVFSAVLCSLVVIVTNGLPLVVGVTEYFSFGPLGAFTFAGKFFLLFAMYPLGLKLLQEADIPKRLFCAALALGAGTFTLTALPGTPSIQNVIASVALGTDLFAGAWLGIVGGLGMFGGGMWYLERQRLRAKANGEHFVPGPGDIISNVKEEGGSYPNGLVAFLPLPLPLPLVLVLLTIIVPRLLKMSLDESSLAGAGTAMELLRFANSQPIVWPCIALISGTVLAIILFSSVRQNALQVMGKGAQDSIMPLINTATVIGFGGAVTHTVGFERFIMIMVESVFRGHNT